jgi:hypothetical protein
MRIKAKLYVPKVWNQLDRPLRQRIQDVEHRLRSGLRATQPTYAQLADFIFKSPVKASVRKSVAEAVQRRSRFSYTMTQEIACFQSAIRDMLVGQDDSIYQAASTVRGLMFGSTEPMRIFNMTITYHEWMRIEPPAPADPVFTSLSAHKGPSALFGALNTYLILLTSHPFSDGNGRTSRLMFNILLAKAFGSTQHYIPLNELTRSTHGVYEEYIGDACRHGNFRQLIWLLLGLLESYVSFLHERALDPPQSEVAKVLAWAGARQTGSEGPGINDIPPYLISVSQIVGDPDTRINNTFLNNAVLIAESLSKYGTIQFAITSLADLVDGLSPPAKAIAFFIDVQRKEDLTLHFRELRAKYSRTLNLQLSVASGDAAIDAKILITLFTQYTCRDPTATACPVFLHDFVA